MPFNPVSIVKERSDVGVRAATATTGPPLSPHPVLGLATPDPRTRLSIELKAQSSKVQDHLPPSYQL